MGKEPTGAPISILSNGIRPRPKRTAFDAAVSVRLVSTAAAVEECAKLILSESHLIGLTELRILDYLAERTGASVSVIGRDLQVDKAWISRLLKQLEERGLVQREKHASDPRQLIVSLTPPGATFHATVMARVEPYRDEIGESVDEQHLIDLLDQLDSNIRKLIARLRSNV